MDNLTKVSDLVDRFGRNPGEYKAGRYNETQVRREFTVHFSKRRAGISTTKKVAQRHTTKSCAKIFSPACQLFLAFL